MAGIFAAVLGVERVGVEDDFFSLGGHSLLATQLTSRVRASLGVELPLRAVFEAPTVAELAARIAAERPAAELEPDLIVPIPREGALPLSFAQQRLWFLDQWEPGSPLYNMPAAVGLRGRLDRAALAAALGEITRRHEALRTTFREEAGEPVQVIAPPAPFPLPLIDLQGLPVHRREEAADRLAAAEARRPFDLGRGPLARAALLRLGDEEHTALMTLHHIVSDGWSTGLMVRELGALYTARLAGAPSPLPELAIQYADFAAWQRRRLSGDFLARELAWWRGQLQGLPSALELPVDRRPAAIGTRGGVRSFALGEPDHAALQGLARDRGATLFMVLLAGFAALLRRYTGEDDLAVGTPVAGRTRVETEPLIGLFVNTLVLRVELAGDPEFADLLERARETTLAAYAHQEVPFERLVEELVPERDLSRPPLVQVLLALQDAPADDLRLSGLALRAETLETGTAKLELACVITETARGLTGRIEYNRDLFESATIERLAGHLARLLAGAAAQPSQRLSDLPLLSGAEREELLGWRRSPGDWALPGTAHALFAEQARLRPEAVALVAGDRRMSYGELARRSGSLAAALRRLGVGPEVRVALSAGRSFDLVVGILGILRAGGALVPLDPTHPAERLALLLEDSGPAVVVSQRELPVSGPATLLLGEVEDADWTDLEIPEETLAYVIYTSGSTGRPKGVGVSHANLVPMLRWSLETFGLGEGRRVLQSLSYAFDFGLWEILTAVSSGAALHVPPAGEAGDADAFARRAVAEGIDTVHATPSFFRAVAETGARLEGLRVLHLGGEALSRSGVERLAAAVGEGCTLYNGYGPTEATVNSLLFEIGRPGALKGGELTPIGRPSAENADLRSRPLGGPGAGGDPRRAVGGRPGVARGYLGRPELTAERFIPDGFGSEPGGRLYRTGDLARWLPDGTVEFLGRVDDQVKVRGFRIEPGEVEAALRRHPEVREAVVMARGERLVAYVVAEAEGAEIQAFAGGLLPAALVPSVIVRLDGLPLTPTGKVDRRALPEPDFAPEEEPVAPRTPHEALVAGVFAEVLGAERVGPSSDFFLLGGHSLLATRVVSRLRAALGVELPVRALFEAPTVAELAARIAGEIPAGGAPERTPLVPAARPEPLPLSFAQERLWFLDQLEGGGPLYNVPVAWRLRGPLDADRLAAALRGVAARHESLRTTFPAVDGKPVQAVAAEPSLELERVDLDEAAALARLEEEVRRPFDLARGPLARALLIRLPADNRTDDHLLALTLHHTVADGGSMGVLFRELAALYAGESLAGAAGAVSRLRRLAARLAPGRDARRPARLLARRIPTAPQPLDLPTDRPRPAAQTFRGGAVPVELPAELARGVRDLARRRGATAFMTLLAGWAAVLHRWSGQEDFALGSPVANRRPEVEGLIGFFVNLLPLRMEPAAGLPFAELLDKTRARALAAYAHQDVPFERLVEELAPGRDLSRAPVVQAVLALEDGPAARLRLPEIAAEPVPVHTGTAKFELVLALAGEGDGLSGGLEYNADLFDAATARRMAGHLLTLLAGAVAEPGREVADLSLLTADESRQVLVDWTATAAPFARGRGLHELFEEQVERDAGRHGPGLGDRAADLSRARRARRPARPPACGGSGVGPETLVGVFTRRTSAMVAALIAVLKAGGAYVPLDPAYPAERVALLLGDTQAPVLITESALASPRCPPYGGRVLLLDRPEEGAEGELPRGLIDPDQIAYTIYTSGSTGKPKAILIRHSSAVAMIAWSLATYPADVLGGHARLDLDLLRHLDLRDLRPARGRRHGDPGRRRPGADRPAGGRRGEADRHRPLRDGRAAARRGRAAVGPHRQPGRRAAAARPGRPRLRAPPRRGDLRPLRPVGGHHLLDRLDPASGRDPRADHRPAAHQLPGLRARSAAAAGAGGGARRGVDRRRGSRPRLSQPAGADGGPLPPRSVRGRSRVPPLPRRRPRALAAGRRAGVPRPPRPPGEDPRLPRRAGGDRGGARPPPPGARGGGGRPRRGGHPRPARLRRSGRNAGEPGIAGSRRRAAALPRRAAAALHGPRGVPAAPRAAAHPQRQGGPQGAGPGRAGGRARRAASSWLPATRWRRCWCRSGPRSWASSGSASSTISSPSAAIRCWGYS